MKIILTQDTKAGTYDLTDIEGSMTLTLDTPAPVSPPSPSPPPPVVSESVQVTGTLADGTAVNLSLSPGQRLPMGKDATGGSVVFHADGLSVCIENAYVGLAGDLSGTFNIAAGSTTLFSGPLTIWAYARTRPFWIKPPVANPDADFSCFPKYGMASPNASLLAAYQKGDNSPMGIGLPYPSTGNTGDTPLLGEPPEWDAIYLNAPSADNASVVRGMADACGPRGFHAIDFATNKMLDVTQYPNATMLQAQIGAKGNPFTAYTSKTPYSLDQAGTHAPDFCALACRLFGTDYDKEELSLWANYIGGLWGNSSYRLPAGCYKPFAATRNKARTLALLTYASVLSDNAPLFTSWMNAFVDACNTLFLGQTGIQIDQAGAAVEGYPNGLFAPWQQTMLVHAVGHAITNGYTKAQPLLDYFGQYLFDAMLVGPHELLTIYNLSWVDSTGKPLANWAAGLQTTAQFNPLVAAALQCPESSQALQDALGKPTHLPGDFWAGDPTENTNYIAQAQGAYAVLADHATDQVSAQAAWAKFSQFNRINYATNPKYNKVPRAA